MAARGATYLITTRLPVHAAVLSVQLQVLLHHPQVRQGRGGLRSEAAIVSAVWHGRPGGPRVSAR
jgi:hypothetical protein